MEHQNLDFDIFGFMVGYIVLSKTFPYDESATITKAEA